VKKIIESVGLGLLLFIVYCLYSFTPAGIAMIPPAFAQSYTESCPIGMTPVASLNFIINDGTLVQFGCLDSSYGAIALANTLYVASPIAATDQQKQVSSALYFLSSGNLSTIHFSCGTYTITSAINLTNMSGVTFEGCGSQQQVGGDYGTRLTSFVANTGDAGIEMDGSSYMTLRQFQIRSASTQSAPAVVGIIQGRNTTNTNTQFSQFNVIDTVEVYLDTIPTANSNQGTIGIYNIGAEHTTYRNMKVIADRGLNFAATNVRTITPPYHTLSGPASMSTVSLNEISCSAWTAECFGFWKSQDFTITRGHCLNNGTSVTCVTFADLNQGINIEMQVEGYTSTHAFTFNNNDNTHINIDAEIVSPATTIFVFQNSTGVQNSVWRVFQKNGTPQSLFTAGTSSFFKGGAIYATGFSGILASTLTVTGSVVSMPDVAFSSITTSSTSQYDYYGSDGFSLVGTRLWQPITFASLGTPTNGTMLYCSDCTRADPCAGSGTGALAKRLNSAWSCL
jgi:hypothetical protein